MDRYCRIPSGHYALKTKEILDQFAKQEEVFVKKIEPIGFLFYPYKLKTQILLQLIRSVNNMGNKNLQFLLSEYEKVELEAIDYWGEWKQTNRLA